MCSKSLFIFVLLHLPPSSLSFLLLLLISFFFFFRVSFSNPVPPLFYYLTFFLLLHCHLLNSRSAINVIIISTFTSHFHSFSCFSFHLLSLFPFSFPTSNSLFPCFFIPPYLPYLPPPFMPWYFSLLLFVLIHSLYFSFIFIFILFSTSVHSSPVSSFTNVRIFPLLPCFPPWPPFLSSFMPSSPPYPLQVPFSLLS